MGNKKRPIIYIRGFAATKGEIESTVATPYMGFNTGSTRTRQSYDGDMVPFVFESPLVRLMKDFDYEDCFSKGDFRDVTEKGDAVPEASVWVFRYYEKGPNVSSEGQRKSIDEFAQDLKEFIHRVKKAICADPKVDEQDFKVHLVAHSMGGLIARSYLQKHCSSEAESLVDKVFTYGSPHRGIEMRGVNVPDLGWLDSMDVGNFNHGTMRKYLGLKDEAPVNGLNDKFPKERFFCFVGTNHRDYDAFFGLAKRGMGPMSDGLVMMKNAYVQGAARAYAHRSHSGDYGLVNSEEGYQNLVRFLFGDLRVDVFLEIDELTLPREVQRQKDKGHEVRGKYHISTGAGVRNASYLLSERRSYFGSEIRVDYDDLVKVDQDGKRKRVYLFSGFLSKHGKALSSGDSALAFRVDWKIDVPLFEVERRFWLDSHFEHGELYADSVEFFLRPDSVRYRLNSENAGASSGRKLDPAQPHTDFAAPEAGARRYEIPVATRKHARPGLVGRLVLHVRDVE